MQRQLQKLIINSAELSHTHTLTPRTTRTTITATISCFRASQSTICTVSCLPRYPRIACSSDFACEFITSPPTPYSSPLLRLSWTTLRAGCSANNLFMKHTQAKNECCLNPLQITVEHVNLAAAADNFRTCPALASLSLSLSVPFFVFLPLPQYYCTLQNLHVLQARFESGTRNVSALPSTRY